MTKKVLSIAIAVAVAVTAFVGLVGSSEVEARRQGNSIAETALAVNADTGEFDYLIKALVLTDLVDFVDGNRQLTVFAPTDEAFEALDGVSTPDDLESIPVEDLEEILLYHVAPGRRNASAVTSSTRVNTLAKEFIMVDGTVLNDTTNIVLPNQFAANGVIHVIDEVLMPPM
jgi:uncharacterized surface protein with fasciclin (FAS1) repeats